MKEETKKVSEMATAEEVIKSLPGKERPELRIYRIISDEFVRRDEFYEYMKRSDERFERLFNELINGGKRPQICGDGTQV